MYPDRTIAFYDSDPEGYSGKTFEADMSTSRRRFTSHLNEGARILDLGCGSGRDTLAFSKEGFDVTPVDGSEGMCAVAERNTGIHVRRMLFSELDYVNYFDGVWACSSLLHVPSAELPDVLKRIHLALVPEGIFYLTFKEGDFEGEREGRHYTDMTSESLTRILNDSDFEVLKVWTSMEPDRNLTWINAIARRV